MVRKLFFMSTPSSLTMISAFLRIHSPYNSREKNLCKNRFVDFNYHCNRGRMLYWSLYEAWPKGQYLGHSCFSFMWTFYLISHKVLTGNLGNPRSLILNTLASGVITGKKVLITWCGRLFVIRHASLFHYRSSLVRYPVKATEALKDIWVQVREHLKWDSQVLR